MRGQWSGNESGLNRQLRETAAAGHEVLTVEDLNRLGVTESMVRRRKRSGQLVPVTRGVVTLPGTKLTERGRFRASVYAGGRNCCLSHRSALSLHGLVREQGPVEIMRESGTWPGPGGKSRRSEEFGFAIQCHQTRSLPPEQITTVEGIRTVTVERGLLDFASEASDAEVGKALSQGERERSLCWGTLNNVLAGRARAPGAGRLRREMAAWVPAYADTDSEPEEDFLRGIVRSRLPLPVVNQPVEGVVPDFLWRALFLVVELDPYGTHKGYEQFHRDRRKSVLLERLGLRVIRFTWVDEYHHAERTMAELRAIMIQQARLHGADDLLRILTTPS
jgi:very-short-patch-repair endonuclease